MEFYRGFIRKIEQYKINQQTLQLQTLVDDFVKKVVHEQGNVLDFDYSEVSLAIGKREDFFDKRLKDWIERKNKKQIDPLKKSIVTRGATTIVVKQLMQNGRDLQVNPIANSRATDSVSLTVRRSIRNALAYHESLGLTPINREWAHELVQEMSTLSLEAETNGKLIQFATMPPLEQD